MKSIKIPECRITDFDSKPTPGSGGVTFWRNKLLFEGTINIALAKALRCEETLYSDSRQAVSSGKIDFGAEHVDNVTAELLSLNGKERFLTIKSAVLYQPRFVVDGSKKILYFTLRFDEGRRDFNDWSEGNAGWAGKVSISAAQGSLFADEVKEEPPPIAANESAADIEEPAPVPA